MITRRQQNMDRNSSLWNPNTRARGIRSDSEAESRRIKRKVILQPISMRIPNNEGIYFRSKIRPLKEIAYEEFLSKYADHPQGIRVCFDETLSWSDSIQESELITAYGYGLDCWYIVAATVNSEVNSA